MSEKYRTNASGRTIGYMVEGRCTAAVPYQVGTQLFDTRWQEVRTTDGDGRVGVPPAFFEGPWLRQCNLHGYAAAQALRWWWHSIAAAECGKFSTWGSNSLESRLVAYEVTYSIRSARGREIEVAGRTDYADQTPVKETPAMTPNSGEEVADER
ncbi:MAG: hypothetical protein Q7T05_07065 [Dehalococcoidia bacterium]|nr:hypothetical protein [Dehalococcoidia bacterium]